jgi:hypothetical protein
MAEDLVEDMMAEVRKLGSTYDEFSRRLRNLPSDEARPDDAGLMRDDEPNDQPRLSFVRAAHDFWPNGFVEVVSFAVENLNKQPAEEKRERARQLAESLQAGFDRPPRKMRNQVSLEKDFRDLLNLPIWKKRHELYAVWVASRIADALDAASWQWHPDGDALRFSFGGVELATLRTADFSTHIFWTEKRTALKGGGLTGRKHIQPDYRIMTVPTQSDESTSLVVECKQYRKGSKKNFVAALDDYAKGCPAARVILVNYGPTNSDILELVDPSRRSRTFLVGDFKPREDVALNRFRELVQGAYPALPTPPFNTSAEIELNWSSTFRDLDLHLFIRPSSGGPVKHVGLGTKGSLNESPWAEWHEDVMNSPPGIERITIARWLDAEYSILVHDYSGSPDFPQGDVTLTMKSAHPASQRTFVPCLGYGRWWEVYGIDGASGRVKEVNRLHAECPYSAG